MTAPPAAAAVQAKALKTAAAGLVLAGLLVGIGLPVVLGMFEIQIAAAPWGFDLFWLATLALMAIDFVLAWRFWRRAMLIQSSANGVRP